MKKLDKLILGSFLGPFLLTFIVVDFILLTVNMLKYFDEIFGKGLSFWIYAELIGYFVISISPMALPLAVLLSSLMTFGNLGEHFELTAIKSSGISLLRALRPIGVFVIILSFAAYLSNNYLVPKVNLKTFSLLYDIRMKSPALDIKAGVFYAGIPGYSIKVNEKVGEYGLKDIIIYSHAGGSSGNLNMTLADSGRMEPFFNENYMKLSLFQGINYSEERQTRGIKEKPVEFNRTSFDTNEIVFDLNNTFKLNRTAEDAWSTNRSIKNISQIKLGLDSISTLLNDKLYQNYQSTESIYPFFTRDRKFDPPVDIAQRKFLDDSVRKAKFEKEEAIKDSLENLKFNAKKDTSAVLTDNPEARLLSRTGKDSAITSIQSIKVKTTSVQDSPNITANTKRQVKDQPAALDSAVKPEAKVAVKVTRTAPLTDKEKKEIDSLVEGRGIKLSAVNMALNNSRSLKNNFSIRKTEIDNYKRDYRRFQIAWYQKYTQAFACFAMFLIGAPLGAIIKKGGLGMPVLVSIIFFIVYYMLTITGEKWAKEGLTDPLFGTWFSILCLLPFGLFFIRQARKDSRLFEPDFYLSMWKSVQNRIKVLRSKAN
ncbi:LptF/LptG family permease [Algoriphagus winogradskyi]|uniref:Lipopolysaccharide export system permease protein n=1 Tax=Algoriphagus winogradskyi TaxID=237017 RepID=A0ABY1P4B1_9BACT|nr:LptF/LptG family permease [Algoriphagus winogradskyi]SMP26067.1 lipopolysaccharide export system permease protein [Algoriphagus winogradskyi]